LGGSPLKIESSALLNTVYDAAAQQLTVLFRDRSCYSYDRVPDHVYQAFAVGAIPGKVL
jgi:hypothetical protein